MKSQRSGLPLVCHPYLNVYIVNWISLFLTYACFNLILMPTFSDWWPSIGWSMFMLSSIYLSSQLASMTVWHIEIVLTAKPIVLVYQQYIALFMWYFVSHFWFGAVCWNRTCFSIQLRLSFAVEVITPHLNNIYTRWSGLLCTDWAK